MRVILFQAFLLIVTISNTAAQKLSIRDLHKVYACQILSVADTFLENHGYMYAASFDTVAIYKYSDSYDILLKYGSEDYKIKQVVFSSKKAQSEWDFNYYYEQAQSYGYKLIQARPREDLMEYFYVHDWKYALNLVITKRTESFGQKSFVMVNLW